MYQRPHCSKNKAYEPIQTPNGLSYIHIVVYTDLVVEVLDVLPFDPFRFVVLLLRTDSVVDEVPNTNQKCFILPPNVAFIESRIGIREKILSPARIVLPPTMIFPYKILYITLFLDLFQRKDASFLFESE